MISDLISKQPPRVILLKTELNHISSRIPSAGFLFHSEQKSKPSPSLQGPCDLTSCSCLLLCSLSHIPPLPPWSPWWLLSSTAMLPPQDLSPCCSFAVSALCSAIGRLALSSPQTDMSHPIYTLPSQTLPIHLTSFVFLYDT